jgi:hypothetical protein
LGLELELSLSILFAIAIADTLAELLNVGAAETEFDRGDGEVRGDLRGDGEVRGEGEARGDSASDRGDTRAIGSARSPATFF